MANEERTQVAVLGGGPGGYAAAFAAADRGLSVTIVDEDERLGGVCLQRGCIPSKALLHVAALIREAQEASRHGVSFGEPKIDVDRLRAFKEEVVGRMTSGLAVLARTRKVRVVTGRGRLLDAHALQVTPKEGEPFRLAFDYCVVATGSRPARVPGLELESPRVWDSTAALELREVPKRLLVVGGGYIGAELATVYAALGSQVTLVELTEGLLPGVDRDLVRPLAARLSRFLAAMHFETRVVEMKETKKGVRVRLQGKDVKEPEAEFEAVLVAVGRTPNSQDIGLETTRAKVDAKGFVEVDLARRTAEPSIFAIGDVAGQPMLAHKAGHEARVAADAIAGHNVAFEPQAIPAVVFTDPEIAWTGLTETEAKARGVEVQVARYPWAASGRAATLGRNDGLTKILVDPGTKRILGVGIAGPGAGELIGEATHAIEMGAVAEDLALTIHPHPTLSETLMGAAELIYGHAIEYYG
ncbi:MAG: dihydrolipoyl dehydrogenase [Clostridia bacterium]|nr:dihydrolipoyl dehydrogenase [Clostridia bacterium]